MVFIFAGLLENCSK